VSEKVPWNETTKDQLLIDKAVLREARVKKGCMAMEYPD
jgi:hypothetical protein